MVFLSQVEQQLLYFAANPKANGEFYAANNRGLFSSVDSGISWRALDIVWPKEYYLQPL